MWKAMRVATVAILAGAALSPLAACGADAPQRIAPPTRIPDPPPVSAEPTGASVPSASVPSEVRRAVVVDAARRFKVAESAVVLGQVEQVTWNDGSLGCPRRGQMYTQNLVAGYRIVATTSERQMVYHTDSHGFAVTCGSNGASNTIQPPVRPAPDR